MSYTSLHRAVGALPGRVTAAMLQQAVDGRLGESDDLDWKQDGNVRKRSLPPTVRIPPVAGGASMRTHSVALEGR